MTSDDLPPGAHATSLTNAFRNAGVLAGGQVTAVAVETDCTTVLSRIVRLRPGYDRPAPEAPATVILKTGLPHTMNLAWNGGRQEVAFSTRVAPGLPPGTVPRCSRQITTPARAPGTSCWRT
jgi:hypothetical protein